MGVLHRLSLALVASTCALVALAPTKMMRDMAFQCRPSFGCFPSMWDSPWELPIVEVTQDSFAVELREAYRPLDKGGKPVFLLMYTDIMDDEIEEFMPVWEKYAYEAQAKGVKVAMIDRMRRCAVGWARAFEYKSYTSMPFVFLLREGRWYAAKTLVASKLNRITANLTTDPLHYFAEEGWAAPTSGSGRLPPPATDEEVTRAVVIQTFVRTVDLLRLYWKYELAFLAFLAVLGYMPRAKPRSRKETRAKEA